MNFKFIPIFLFIIISCIGCSTVQKRQIKQTSVLSAAINDSIRAGRFDRAKEFSDQLVKLTPPPKSKERIKINAFKSVKVNVSNKKGIFTKEELIPDKKFIVLPEGFDTSSVVVKNDDKFKDILKNNPILKKEEIKVDKIVSNNDKTIDKILIDKEKELNKLRADNKGSGFFSSIFGFFKGILGFSVVGTIVVIIVCAFFAPQLLPLVFNVIGFMFQWLINLLINGCKGVYGLVKNLFNKDKYG